MSGHTPGPWLIEPDWDPTEPRVRVYTQCEGEEIGLGVADAFGDSEEEARANAHLIAAAPDMEAALSDLDAYLQNVLDILDDYKDDLWAADLLEQGKPRLQRLQAALAKAKGGESR